MAVKFNIFIDNSFFVEGISIDVIKKFKILFEVARQLKADTFYNENAFKDAVNGVNEEYRKPKLKQEIIKFISDFKGVQNFIINPNYINIHFKKNSNPNSLCFSNAKETWNFINSKLQKRIFNTLYEKHGRKRDNGSLIEAWAGESQLYTTDEESQNLLEQAIFDLRKRSNFYVNYDFGNQKFILFPNENTLNNTFHAYHILINEETKYVPNSILNFFKSYEQPQDL